MIIILDYGCIIEIVCFIIVKIEKNDYWFCIFLLNFYGMLNDM